MCCIVINIYVYIYISTHCNENIYIYMYIYIYVCVYVYICTRIYIYIYADYYIDSQLFQNIWHLLGHRSLYDMYTCMLKGFTIRKIHNLLV